MEPMDILSLNGKDDDFKFNKFLTNRIICSQTMWARQRYFIKLHAIDLKNFEIISIMNNGNSEKGDPYVNPYGFNKIYNGLGVQKYLQFDFSFIKISRVFNEIDLFRSFFEIKDTEFKSKLSPYFIKTREGSENFEKNITIDF